MPAYKDDTTKTWYVRFYYETNKGDRKQKTKRGFKKRADALEFERDFLAKMEGSTDMTFGALYDDYMQDMQKRLKVTTYSGKKYMFDSKILPHFESFKIIDIKPIHIRKWQNDLLTQDYKPTYLKTINNQLSAIFNYAVRYYNLPKNPVRLAGSIGNKHANTINFWTLDEFDQAMSYFEGFNEYKTLYNLMFYSGMRIGEAQALTLNDFDNSDMTVSINKTYKRFEGHDLITEPKTDNAIRTITLPEFIFEMIDEYRQHLYDVQPHERLFFRSKKTIDYHFKKCADWTKTKIIRLHDLRHSHASLLIEMGVNPIAIQERLGHKDVETTLNTYSHLYPNTQKDIANQLNLLRPN